MVGLNFELIWDVTSCGTFFRIFSRVQNMCQSVLNINKYMFLLLFFKLPDTDIQVYIFSRACFSSRATYPITMACACVLVGLCACVLVDI